MISSKQACLLAAGFSAGAILAVLFAPQSGAETRKAIDDSVNGVGEKLAGAGDYLRDQADRLNKDAQSALQHTGSQVNDVIRGASKAITATLEDASKIFSENLERASSAIASAAGKFSGD